MKPSFKFFLFLIFLLSLVSCNVSESILSSFQPKAPEKITSLPRPLTTVETKIIASTNEFGLTLFKEVIREKPNENIFISPLSVSFALGMTYNGAAGTTKSAMRSVLGFGTLTEQEINESYKNLIDLLVSLDSEVQFTIANSIWYRQDFTVIYHFIDLARTYFYASVQGLDFDSPSAVDIINKWVDDNTNGKIKSIIEDIPPDMVMYLINAIYFKGNWTAQFDPGKTSDGLFYLSNGSQKTVKMMTQENDFSTGAFDSLSVIDIPYGSGAFCMTIILPKWNVPISDVLYNLTATEINRLTQNLAKNKLILTMPKFKLEFESKLNNYLINMGMGIAFDSRYANFTNINPLGGLFISEVKHKTYVNVNEEGTEAAAVTSVGIMCTAAPESFIVNRPFIFLLRERLSNTILFVGKIENPSY